MFGILLPVNLINLLKLLHPLHQPKNFARTKQQLVLPPLCTEDLLLNSEIVGQTVST
jgi:hypothetical protein